MSGKKQKREYTKQCRAIHRICPIKDICPGLVELNCNPNCILRLYQKSDANGSTAIE